MLRPTLVTHRRVRLCWGRRLHLRRLRSWTTECLRRSHFLLQKLATATPLNVGAIALACAECGGSAGCHAHAVLCPVCEVSAQRTRTLGSSTRRCCLPALLHPIRHRKRDTKGAATRTCAVLRSRARHIACGRTSSLWRHAGFTPLCERLTRCLVAESTLCPSTAIDFQRLLRLRTAINETCSRPGK